jgi:hypothetical protein
VCTLENTANDVKLIIQQLATYNTRPAQAPMSNKSSLGWIQQHSGSSGERFTVFKVPV